MFMYSSKWEFSTPKLSSELKMKNSSYISSSTLLWYHSTFSHYISLAIAVVPMENLKWTEMLFTFCDVSHLITMSDEVFGEWENILIWKRHRESSSLPRRIHSLNSAATRQKYGVEQRWKAKKNVDKNSFFYISNQQSTVQFEYFFATRYGLQLKSHIAFVCAHKLKFEIDERTMNGSHLEQQNQRKTVCMQMFNILIDI